MRKLKLQVQISVDGYIADVNSKTDWLTWNWSNHWNWDDNLKHYFNHLTASVDCVLLSRKMATEGFIGHWSMVAQNPDDTQYSFAKIITDAQKVVFSKTLKKSEWHNTDIARGDLAVEVNNLKKQTGKDIIVYGGAAFVSSLIKEGLIDEYHLFINPVVLGDGMPIFKELHDKLSLALIKADLYKCGIAVLTYVPA